MTAPAVWISAAARRPGPRTPFAFGWLRGALATRVALACLLLGLSAAATAAPRPYDESADAKAAVREAIATASRTHLPVLIFFGANWCGDCVALDRELSKGPSAALVAKSFSVVKVDVGNWDRNLDLVAAYGNPIRKGIPAAVVVSDDNRIVYATRAGELADARTMSATGIYEFFKRVSEGVAPAK